jgi:hypothetical protein
MREKKKSSRKSQGSRKVTVLITPKASLGIIKMGSKMRECGYKK